MGYQLLNAIEMKADGSGILEILEGINLPFTPQRIYWIKGVPNGATRGHHAHKELRQVAVIVSGSVTIELSDHREVTEVEMKNDGKILIIEPGYWRVMKNFSSDAILMVLADSSYDENDYIRNWDEYLGWKKNA